MNFQQEKYGLTGLTPIYSQVIMSAPTWSGPYEAPPIAPQRIVESKPAESETGKWLGAFGNFAVTAACSIAAPEIMLACPVIGKGADIGINKLFNL